MNDLQDLLNIAGMTTDAIKSGKLVWVVRCKDCKNGCLVEWKNVVTCKDEDHPLNWFCADGERRDGDD